MTFSQAYIFPSQFESKGILHLLLATLNQLSAENLLIIHHLPILHLVFPPIYHFNSPTLSE